MKKKKKKIERLEMWTEDCRRRLWPWHVVEEFGVRNSNGRTLIDLSMLPLLRCLPPPSMLSLLYYHNRSSFSLSFFVEEVKLLHTYTIMGKPPKNSGLKKGPWTVDEDQKLLHYILQHGHSKWRTVPKNAGLERCGKSCRLRWMNYLRPDIKRGSFSLEEEDIIIQLHSVLGNKWSTIASHLPGRTDNEIKNHWNTHIKKKLLKQGIDPVTHTLRRDLLQLHSFLNSSPDQLINVQNLLQIQYAINNPKLFLFNLLVPNSLALPQAENLQNYLHIDNQFCNSQAPTSTTSNIIPSFLLDKNTTLVEANSEQLNWSSFKINSENSLPILCQDHNGYDQSSIYINDIIPSFGEFSYADQNYEMLEFDNSNGGKNIATINVEFGSVRPSSTPSSSTSQYWNSCTRQYWNPPTSHVNQSSTDQDDNDTYCSSLMFDDLRPNFGF